MALCLMDIIERTHVKMCDIPGNFLQTDWPDNMEGCYLRFESVMVKILCEINPEYRNHVIYSHNGKKQGKFKKAVYVH